MYGTVNVSLVLYGCETWAVSLREEHRPRVIKCRVLGRGGITGKWSNLHIEEPYDLYCSPDMLIVSRRMSWMGYVTCMAETRCAYRVLWCKFEGERPFGRPRHRWEDDMKNRSGGSRIGVGGGGMNGIDLAENRDKWLLWTLMNLQVP